MAETGPRIDGVTVRRRLAVGGMAEVFLADQTLADGTQRAVVIKQLLPGADHLWRSLFAREREALAAIDSPFVVELLDGSDDHLLLEYIDGPDLSAVLGWHGRRGRTLSIGGAVAAIEGLLAGLEDVHGATDLEGETLGLVHRDVNPSNVLLTRTGRIKLIDLGVARMTAGEQTTVAGVKGTLGYMAPEQLAGRPVDRRADLYAAGLVMYELLTGVAARPPGSAGLAELIAARGRLPAAPSSLRPDLPQALDHAVLSALAPRVEDRPADCASLLALVRRAGVAPAPADLAIAANAVEAGGPQLQRTVGPDASEARPGSATRVSSTTIDPATAAPAPRRRDRVGAWVAALAMLAALAIVGLSTAGLLEADDRAPAPRDPRPRGDADATSTAAVDGESLAPDSASAIVTDVEIEEGADDATDGGSLTSRTPTNGQADASEPPQAEVTAPEPPPDTSLGPTPAPRPRVEFRKVNHALYVKGPGVGGLASQRSRPFGAAAQVFTLGGGDKAQLKATVRVSWTRGRFKARIQGSSGTAFDDVQCGGRSYGPSATVTFRRAITCSAVTPTGASMRFALRAIAAP